MGVFLFGSGFRVLVFWTLGGTGGHRGLQQHGSMASPMSRFPPIDRGNSNFHLSLQCASTSRASAI